MRSILASVALFVVLAALAGRGDAITRDEGPFLDYGRRHLSGDDARRQVFNSKLPVTSLHALATLGDAPIVGRQVPEAALGHGRCVAIALGALLVLVIGLAGRALAGARAGQAAALLAALEPNLLAHGHLVTADGGAALATLLLALATVRVARTGSLRDVALAGAAFGATLLCKFMLVVWGPLAAIAVALASWRRAAPETKWTVGRAAAAAGVFLAVAILVVDLGHGFRGVPGHFPAAPRSRKVSLVAPLVGALPLPDAFLAGLDWTASDEEHGTGFGNLYHLGELRTDRHGWWHYYLVTGLLKLPLGLLVLGAVALSRRDLARGRDKLLIATMAVGWLLFLSVANRAQIGLRHALPVVPLLVIEAGAAFACLERAGGWRRWVARACVVGVALSVGLRAPDFIPYVNELARGPAYRWVGDSNLDWGQADESARSLCREALAAGRPITLMPEGRVTGRVLVSASALLGITAPPERYEWLRELEPVGDVRGAWVIFDVK